jgi:hypothetical protein
MSNVIRARMEKTLLLYHDRDRFVEYMRYDVGRLVRRAADNPFLFHGRARSRARLRTVNGWLASSSPAVQFESVRPLRGC